MPNEIDELMDKDPLNLSEQDIDAIIAYQRKMKGISDSGVKPSKVAGPKVAISLESLGLKKPSEPVKRRV